MFLSFILPAYNVESFLNRCIDSIYSQNLKTDDFEVIIVNDGSSDKTGEIAESLLQSGKYSNLSVVHQKNMGLSGARNTGLSCAKGNYVWFVDSDDWLNENSISEIHRIATETNADLIFFNLEIIQIDELHKTSKPQPLPKNIIISGADAIIGHYQPCSACTAIMRKAFITNNNLEFYPRLFHQDVQFMYRAVALADKIIFTDFSPYVYEKHLGTISTSLNIEKIIKRLCDEAIIADSFIHFAEKFSDKPVSKRIKQQGLSIALGTLYALLNKSEYQDPIIKHEVLKKFRCFKLFPVKSPSKNLKRLLATALINYKLRNYGKSTCSEINAE